MTHKELVIAAHRWLVSETKCGIAFREYKSSRFSTELPDVIGFDGDGLSYVIECKASRADFLADANKLFRQNPETGMGAQRYYCCHESLLKVKDMPRLWGLLHVNDDGRAYLAHDPYEPDNGFVTRHERSLRGEYKVMYSALRRLGSRGLLEEVYEKPSAAKIVAGRAAHRARDGEIWNLKGRPNQQVAIQSVEEYFLVVKSLKTKITDKIKTAKFYQQYEKGEP